MTFSWRMGSSVRAWRALSIRAARAAALRLIHMDFAGWLARGLSPFDRRRATSFEGRVNAIRFRHADHTSFWQAAEARFPGDPQFVRGRIEAALRAGHLALAQSGLDWLIAQGHVRYGDWKFVVGLCHADHCAGRPDAARARIRSWLKAFVDSGERRVAALKISRLIFTHFGRGQTESRARSLHMLSLSPVRAAPREVLLRVARCEERLAANGATLLSDTDVTPAQCRQFIRVVRARLAAREPFSLVRVGDGEAACLAYEPALALLQRADGLDRERIWWGEPLPPPLRAKLGVAVSRAIWDADCIGLPTIARYLRELDLTRADSLEDRLTGRGLLAILYNAERIGSLRSVPEGPMVVSCHLHQELARFNLYGELLDGVKEVVLVSCHPTLADWIAEKFHVGVAGHIVVPPDEVSGPVLDSRQGPDKLPAMLDGVTDALARVCANRLVLVGAGYPGKAIVASARAHGGVALDLGSIFDFWLGLHTRSYLDQIPA